MAAAFSENDVHTFMYAQGIEALVDDAPEVDEPPSTSAPPLDDDQEFELWRIVKARALDKLRRIHSSVRYGDFVGSKVKLPIDKTTPMELDLIGQHEDGLFILELKVGGAAERNAFSELLGYSNYIAEMFALSGHKDITNVLVANLDVKITRQAFLYDLLITDRNIIVYKPDFVDGTLESLRLKLHIPTDDDFRQFANQLLSHEAMSCAVVSFDDLPGWIDGEDETGSLPSYTKDHLKGLSQYAAQLMEAEHLHGFCFVRKPWNSIPRYYRNSLFICALNPFRFPDRERANVISEQLKPEFRESFFEFPELGFDGRVAAIAQRTIKDGLPDKHRSELELPLWSAIVTSPLEVVYSHNLGYRPTGIFREAYISFLNAIYANNAAGISDEDVSTIKVEEHSNWMRAWMFMEACGFTDVSGEDPDEEGDEGQAEIPVPTRTTTQGDLF